MLLACWLFLFSPSFLLGQDTTAWASEKMMAIQKKEENQRLNRLSYPEHLFESQKWQAPDQENKEEKGIPLWGYLTAIALLLGLSSIAVKAKLSQHRKAQKQELLDSLLASLSTQTKNDLRPWQDIAGKVLSLLSVSSLQKTSIQTYLSTDHTIEKLGFSLPKGKKSADLSIALGEALAGYPGATLQVESHEHTTQTYLFTLPAMKSETSEGSPQALAAEQPVKGVDQQFLSRANQIVEEKMGDAQFNAEAFREEMGMSKTHFYRKIQELTQQSPGQFIRTKRLAQARMLLETGAGNVSEVAYEVGFNNLSYFSRCFRNEFGMLPSEVA